MHGRSRNSGLNTAIGRLHRLRSWYLNKTLSLPFRASFGWRLLFIGAPYYGIEILVRHEPILERCYRGIFEPVFIAWLIAAAPRDSWEGRSTGNASNPSDPPHSATP